MVLNPAPVPMSRQAFIEVLEDVLERVKAGDSMEGSLEYLLPQVAAEGGEPWGDPPDADLMVQAAYRIGNLQGQGGYRIISEMKEMDPDDRMYAPAGGVAAVRALVARLDEMRLSDIAARNPGIDIERVRATMGVDGVVEQLMRTWSEIFPPTEADVPAGAPVVQ